MAVREIPPGGIGEAPARPAPWNDPRVRAIVVQAVVVIALLLLVWYLVDNTITNLRRQGIAGGWGFLDKTAGFGISFSLISYEVTSSYGRALIVGFLNTILVAVIGIFLATIVGFVVGLARLSSNWLIARLATVYVEVIRNIPLLLQLIFWYVAVLSALPGARDALTLGQSVFLSNRGLTVPRPIFEPGSSLLLWALIVGLAAAVGVSHWAQKRFERTGQAFPSGWASLGLIVGLPVLAFLLAGRPISLEFPEASRFRLVGGLNLVPEFVALLLGLTLYTGAFIAEIVRAGILSVAKGQREAAGALGLRPGQVTRFVIVPQAMRVIVPPLTSQYLNLTKNSSLAVAIGYPELVSIGGTVLNQSGQAIEVVTIWMIVYVSLSLLTSLFMNWYNRRIALVER